MFVISNRSVVTVKFLSWTIWQAPLYLFIIVIAILGVVIFWIIRKIRKVAVDFKQMRNEEKTRVKLVDKDNHHSGENK